MRKLSAGTILVTIFGLQLLLPFSSAQEKKANDSKAAASLQTKAAPPTTGDKAATSGEKLPSAQEVVDRFLKEMGGKEAWQKMSSQHAKGKVEMPAQQMKGDLEVFAADPNKLLLKITLEGAGQIVTGYDGKVAWMMNPFTGPMLIEGKQMEQIATQANFDHILHDPKDYKSMEVTGAGMFEGEECYKLQLVDKNGNETTEYFSKKTGLQKGFTGTQDSPFGPITSTTVIADYKKFGDLLLPTKIVQKISGMSQVMTLTEMEFNKVPDEIFELPAEIKALLEK